MSEDAAAHMAKVRAFLAMLQDAGVRRWRGFLHGDGGDTDVEFFPVASHVAAAGAIQAHIQATGVAPIRIEEPGPPSCACGHLITEHNAQGFCVYACDPKKCSPPEEVEADGSVSS